MSLTRVWLQTQGDGLVRADQVVGIDAHQTLALTGKPARWLLDVVLPSSVGNGQRGEWDVNVLHRTLVQTSESPRDAPTTLARLLAQLDVLNAAGIVTVTRPGARREARPESEDGFEVGSSVVRFRFEPFPSAPAARPADSEYL